MISFWIFYENGSDLERTERSRVQKTTFESVRLRMRYEMTSKNFALVNSRAHGKRDEFSVFSTCFSDEIESDDSRYSSPFNVVTFTGRPKTKTNVDAFNCVVRRHYCIHRALVRFVDPKAVSAEREN